ncbi:type IV secretory system conjugative DNA transfer family protein [Vibrio sp. R78045]|uniref:type IV secretory system conjugative DNA transfer family protein n=1 Tax=Vibrio sp. R78045 TaxID=3093868 RepID=UPI0036F411BB
MSDVSAFKAKTTHAMANDLFTNKSNHVDTRPYLTRLLTVLPYVYHVLFYVAAISALVFPTFTYFIVVGMAFFALYAVQTQFDYLISVPTFSRGNGFMAEDGIRESTLPFQTKEKSGNSKAYMLLGYDLLFGRQMWMDVDRETRMSFISGTTGAGKTVCQNSQLLQSCIQGHFEYGAPVILMDGKGSIEGLYQFLFYIIRTGRIHDVRILNFLTGGITQDPKAMLDDEFSSNKFNPFSVLNKEESRGLVMSFGRSSEGGNGDFFRDRASTMLAGEFSVLCYRRDKFGEPLDASVIRKFTELRNMFRAASDKTVPEDVRQPLKEYLKTLNGVQDAHFEMDVDKGFEINPKAEEQHTYNRSMLSKTLNEMTESLGHIFCSTGSDINLRHAISHGQIVLVLLPTIEKESESMKELGRMMVGSLRPAFAPLLGFNIQGTKAEVVDALPSNRVVPVRLYLDEVLNYYTAGISNFLSLMRSSQVSMTLIGQSLKGIEDAGVSEGRQSLANLNNKIMFATQDVYETMELINKSVGKATQIQSSQMHGSHLFGWSNADTLQIQDAELIDSRDMASANPMEGLYIFRGQVTPFRSATFFPDDDRDGSLDSFKLNIFAELLNPTSEEVERIRAIASVADSSKNGSLKPIDSTKHSNELIKDFCSKLQANLNSAKKMGTQYENKLHILTYTLADDLLLDSEDEFEAQKAKLKDQSHVKHETGNQDVDLTHVVHEDDSNHTIVEPTAEMFGDYSGFMSSPPAQESPPVESYNDVQEDSNGFDPVNDVEAANVTDESSDFTPSGLLERTANQLGISSNKLSKFELITDDIEPVDQASLTEVSESSDNKTNLDASHDQEESDSLDGLLMTGGDLTAHLSSDVPFGTYVSDDDEAETESESSEKDSSENEDSESIGYIRDLFDDSDISDDNDDSNTSNDSNKDKNSESNSGAFVSQTIDDIFSHGESVTGQDFKELKETILTPPKYPVLPELAKMSTEDQQLFVDTVQTNLEETEGTLSQNTIDEMF